MQNLLPGMYHLSTPSFFSQSIFQITLSSKALFVDSRPFSFLHRSKLVQSPQICLFHPQYFPCIHELFAVSQIAHQPNRFCSMRTQPRRYFKYPVSPYVFQQKSGGRLLNLNSIDVASHTALFIAILYSSLASTLAQASVRLYVTTQLVISLQTLLRAYSPLELVKMPVILRLLERKTV